MSESTQQRTTRRKYPLWFTIAGVLVSVWLVYNALDMMFIDTSYIGGKLFLEILVILIIILPAALTPDATNVQFDDETQTLIITYPLLFLISHQKHIKYIHVRYNAYHELGVLKTTPTSITGIEFYVNRTIIAQIRSRQYRNVYWDPTELEKIHAKLKTCAREY